MRLKPHVPFDPQETVLSFAGRLAAMHTGQPLTRLLADMQINVEHFTLGRPEAISRFAEIAGADEADLLKATMRGIRGGVEFRGEHCQSAFLSRAADKYCPTCLAEDGERQDWRQRLIWCFAPAHQCPLHGVRLERLEKSSRTLQEGLAQPPGHQDAAASARTPSYLMWLQSRLDGLCSSDNPWLAQQGIQQVLDASLMLGTVLTAGHKVRAKTLPSMAQEKALEHGFAIYAQGPGSVTSALDLIRSTSDAHAVQAGPLAYYGRLYEWLDRQCNDRDPGPIRDLLREHIIKHDAVDVGEVVLGQELRERRYHSVQSLASTLGINRTRMSRLLQKLGKIPVGASDAEAGVLRFDAQAIATLLNDFETAIPMADVADYIGASLSQMQALYASGLIEPLVPRDAPGSVRQVVFARRSLDAFLGRLSELPAAAPGVADTLHPISYACQRGAGTTIEVVRAILAGDLRAYRTPGEHGLAAIVVSPSEAIALRGA
ncbi:TniQ family protein [Alloyangia pacifica]|uniref:TniQ protein n=1 Tax=Alloyangia pacifica TaxID=311180 RepID=A0A1I6WLW0_9RHOB|nr:TniQ family protein [Alloyangia pacifica]SDI92217.1 TniQ protein [Alloyangia pacifica]SFT26979.1 TniQ protein [Alloyangia pacifica]